MKVKYGAGSSVSHVWIDLRYPHPPLSCLLWQNWQASIEKLSLNKLIVVFRFIPDIFIPWNCSNINYPLLWHCKGYFSCYENNVLLNIVLISHEENFNPLTEADIQIHTGQNTEHQSPRPSWKSYKVNSIHKVLRKSHKRSWIKVRTTASECFLWFCLL